LGIGPIPNPQSPIPNIITYYNILLNSKITIITIKHL